MEQPVTVDIVLKVILVWLLFVIGFDIPMTVNDEQADILICPPWAWPLNIRSTEAGMIG